MPLHNMSYRCADEVRGGYLAGPGPQPSTPRPAVLLLHEGGGLSAETVRRADMFASLGYVAFAPDLFGRTFASREEGAAYVGNLVQHPTALIERLDSALGLLKGRSEVDERNLFAVGFCFGGFAALELARAGRDLRAVAAVHGGLHSRRETPMGSIKASILACVGARDPFITAEQRAAFEREMTDAGADWQINIYANAMHAFSNPDVDPQTAPGCAYDALADRRSWADIRSFFGSA